MVITHMAGDSVAATLFGFIKGGIGIGDQRLTQVVILLGWQLLWYLTYTEGNGDLKWKTSIGRYWLSGNLQADTLCQTFRIKECGLRQNKTELLTAIAHGDITGTQTATDAARDLSQYCIASGVTIIVIDPLEVIGIDKDTAEWLMVSLGA